MHIVLRCFLESLAVMQYVQLMIEKGPKTLLPKFPYFSLFFSEIHVDWVEGIPSFSPIGSYMHTYIYIYTYSQMYLYEIISKSTKRSCCSSSFSFLSFDLYIWSYSKPELTKYKMLKEIFKVHSDPLNLHYVEILSNACLKILC